MIYFTKLSSPNLLLALMKWEVHFIYFLENSRKKAIKKPCFSQKVPSFHEFPASQLHLFPFIIINFPIKPDW